MAQLPPKIPPSMAPNWPDFNPHGKLPPPAHNPLWVDEFLDFSSARRAAHRRSVSDSVAFLESPASAAAEEHCCSGEDGGIDDHHHHEFDKFDDEQFLSMFTDEKPGGLGVGPILSSSDGGPSSPPSDHNSINDQKQSPSPPAGDQNQPQPQQPQQPMRNETDEAESLEAQGAAETAGNSAQRIVDPKRVKRILANRQSAQRSRVRKLQYISELERSVTSLQAEVSVLSPRVAFLDHQRLLLNVDNSALKQRIAALAQDKIFKDAHQEALKREIERLRQVYHHQQQQQQQQNLNNDTENNNNADPKSPPPENSPNPS
ncbi:basic leucine zipper 61-like [Punica granatum]|uniref:Basic leucine zipper 61-like n=1 Tax=Punica granatum TaxID=22663 RepID=A0A6P8D8B3_PUNGR|nr:basic leucine zipper 61-like [Punica granatum]